MMMKMIGKMMTIMKTKTMKTIKERNPRRKKNLRKNKRRKPRKKMMFLRADATK